MSNSPAPGAFALAHMHQKQLDVDALAENHQKYLKRKALNQQAFSERQKKKVLQCSKSKGERRVHVWVMMPARRR
jgi:hypothetical protein